MPGTTVEADRRLVELTTLGQTSIGDVLRDARREAGLSITVLAREAGTSRAAVHAYESGSREPRVATAVRLLRCCGVVLTVTLID